MIGNGLSEKKILIVDDEKLVLQTLSRYLSMVTGGATVRECEDLSSAEKVLRETAFSLVITDLHLTRTGGEGLRVLGLAKELHPRASVVVMTGGGSPEYERQAYEMGALAYLEKPVDLKIFERILAAPGFRENK